MPKYVLLRGTESGTRVAEDRSGKTVSIAGRLLDNMSTAAAEDALRSLERLAKLKQEHAAGALRRNDLVAILDKSTDSEA